MRKDFVKSDLVANQLETLDQELASKTKAEPYHPMIRLIADVLDNAIKGDNCYLTIGTTRDQSAIILSLTVEGQKIYVSSATLYELAGRCQELL